MKIAGIVALMGLLFTSTGCLLGPDQKTVAASFTQLRAWKSNAASAKQNFPSDYPAARDAVNKWIDDKISDIDVKSKTVLGSVDMTLDPASDQFKPVQKVMPGPSVNESTTTKKSDADDVWKLIKEIWSKGREIQASDATIELKARRWDE